MQKDTVVAAKVEVDAKIDGTFIGNTVEAKKLGMGCAEQMVLENIANRIDGLYSKEKQPTGTIKMMIDGHICQICQNFESHQPGVIKQFSNEFYNITIILTNTYDKKIIVVKGGKIIIGEK